MHEFLSDSILPPPPPDAMVLHNREYRVQAYRLADDRILLQGAVRDQKPPHLYLREDPRPLTIHHMQVSLEIGFPSLEILGVNTEFETYPEQGCPTIIDRYHELIGLSIARGFTHRVRDLFGGPRGCTHTTALLLAMAPVAMQCFWSMRSASAIAHDLPDPMTHFDPDDQTWRGIVNTCHVWREDGPIVAEREAGVPPTEAPVFLRDRLEELGIDYGGRFDTD